MEKATAVNTCLGVLMGRDCIYLDQVKQDALNNLTFTGDINCLLYTSPSPRDTR